MKKYYYFLYESNNFGTFTYNNQLMYYPNIFINSEERWLNYFHPQRIKMETVLQFEKKIRSNSLSKIPNDTFLNELLIQAITLYIVIHFNPQEKNDLIKEQTIDILFSKENLLICEYKEKLLKSVKAIENIVRKYKDWKNCKHMIGFVFYKLAEKNPLYEKNLLSDIFELYGGAFSEQNGDIKNIIYTFFIEKVKEIFKFERNGMFEKIFYIMMNDLFEKIYSKII